MTSSESVAALATALAKAQARIEGAEKNKINPAFKAKYADLAAVWDACREALTSNGLAVVQAPSSAGALLTVTTRLLHTSGEWIEDAWTVQARDASPQSLMSALTYCRRGALAAFVGVAPEDDDAETAQGRGAHVDTRTGEIHEPPKASPVMPPAKPSEAPPATAERTDLISDKQRKRLYTIAKEAGWKDAEMKAELKKRFGYEHSQDIPWRRYDDVVDYFTHGPAPKEPPAPEPNDEPAFLR